MPDMGGRLDTVSVEKWQDIAEDWAREVVSDTLDAEVEEHDRAQPGDGLYDFKIVRAHRTDALEVTMAADQDAFELARIMDASWSRPELAGGWHVELQRNARWKTVRKELPGLLGRLESNGVTKLDSRVRQASASMSDLALITKLRIRKVWQGGTSRPGSVYFTRSSDVRAAWDDPTGAHLVEWLSEWLIAAEQRDNLEKLDASEAVERHLFIAIPPQNCLTDDALRFMMDPSHTVPSVPLELPPQITDVWLLDDLLFRNTGLWWSGSNGWTAVDKGRAQR